MESTREQILDMIVRLGPIASSEIAEKLNLTAAGIRRHIVALEDDGLVSEHRPTGLHEPRRGRPARHYVATDKGRPQLSDAYSELASTALRYLADVAGQDAVVGFAHARVEELERRYAPVVEAAGSQPLERAVALSEALTRDGYAATIREVGPDHFALQLCQGNCPVLRVAEDFPQLCEAETRVFSKLLGVHVQRLATLAQGEHVCTTHVPLSIRPKGIQ